MTHHAVKGKESVKQSYSYHAREDYFPRTADPCMFYSFSSTAIKVLRLLKNVMECFSSMYSYV